MSKCEPNSPDTKGAFKIQKINIFSLSTKPGFENCNFNIESTKSAFENQCPSVTFLFQALPTLTCPGVYSLAFIVQYWERGYDRQGYEKHINLIFQNSIPVTFAKWKSLVNNFILLKTVKIAESFLMTRSYFGLLSSISKITLFWVQSVSFQTLNLPAYGSAYVCVYKICVAMFSYYSHEYICISYT